MEAGVHIIASISVSIAVSALSLYLYCRRFVVRGTKPTPLTILGFWIVLIASFTIAMRAYSTCDYLVLRWRVDAAARGFSDADVGRFLATEGAARPVGKSSPLATRGKVVIVDARHRRIHEAYLDLAPDLKAAVPAEVGTVVLVRSSGVVGHTRDTYSWTQYVGSYKVSSGTGGSSPVYGATLSAVDILANELTTTNVEAVTVEDLNRDIVGTIRTSNENLPPDRR
jgi:hypothetical protein